MDVRPAILSVLTGSKPGFPAEYQPVQAAFWARSRSIRSRGPTAADACWTACRRLRANPRRCGRDLTPASCDSRASAKLGYVGPGGGRSCRWRFEGISRGKEQELFARHLALFGAW